MMIHSNPLWYKRKPYHPPLLQQPWDPISRTQTSYTQVIIILVQD